ncbi:MAG: ferritin-like domain-containing protein [Gammaproteobacteria bacterium]|nr:ferritin-like domain-containing protein [Gammaproteobacteria bacterium]
MSGHPRIVAYLQRAVSHEFSAAQQFTLQAVQAERLGIGSLADELRAGALDELSHAEAFCRRLHELGAGSPSVQAVARPVGRTLVELLRFGLATEADAMRLYSEALRFCERMADAGNAALFARIHGDEVKHYQELDRRLRLHGAEMRH